MSTVSAATIRGARPSEVGQVHALLIEAIADSVYYDDAFKAFEMARLRPIFIRTLIAIDPWHVTVSEQDGRVVGFALTVPEMGTLWTSWFYVQAQYRSTAAALSLVRANIRHWDHGRFHKLASYVRPDNAGTRRILGRFGFEERVLLRQHIIGHDMILMERPLTRVDGPYDHGMAMSLTRRLWLRLAVRLGL